MLLAFTINAIFYCLFFYIYKDEVFGQGDVLLMTAIGALLGQQNYLGYYVFQTLASGLLALLYMLSTKSRNIAFPMAPIYVFWLGLYMILDKPRLF